MPGIPSDDGARHLSVDSVTDTFPVVPGQMPDIGTKLLDPRASYVGTYRQLWDKLADPKFDVRAWQAMYRWVNDSVPFAGAAFHQWIVEFYEENRLATDTLVMDGRPVRLADIRYPSSTSPPAGTRSRRDRQRVSSRSASAVTTRQRSSSRAATSGSSLAGRPAEIVAKGRRLASHPRLNGYAVQM